MSNPGRAADIGLPEGRCSVKIESGLFRRTAPPNHERFWQTQVVPVRQVDATLLRQWRDLEARALLPNPFLSPRFVLPLVRHMPNHAQVDVVLSFEGAERRLVALAAIERDRLAGFSRSERARMAKSLFLPHAEFLASKYSFLGCTLLDGRDTLRAAEGLLIGLRQHIPMSQLAFFPSMPEEEAAVWQRLGRRDASVRVFGQARQRPTLVPRECGEEYLRFALPRSRYKDLARVRRRLEDRGRVSFRLVRERELAAEAAETFLRLEHLGWKGARGSSLLAHAERAAFFRDFVAAFAETNDVFFCELCCGDEVVASTVNIISGDIGYAFKVSWDPRFAQASPGILNEIETIRAAPNALSDLRYIDSCTGCESFIDRLWTRRRTVFHGALAVGPVGSSVLAATRRLRVVRDRIREFKDTHRPRLASVSKSGVFRSGFAQSAETEPVVAPREGIGDDAA